VDRFNERVKWACANWFGLEQLSLAPGGLDTLPLRELVSRISELGFNCVRLPISIWAVLHNPRINKASVAANPELENLTWHQLFNATVEALADAHLMVIVVRHMLHPGNDPSNVSMAAGLWYGLGISAEKNVQGLATIANMTRHNRYVVGFEPINEPHDVNGTFLQWGGGNPKNDLLLYYETAGNAILGNNPDALILIDGLCVSKTLKFICDRTVQLSQPNRIVYAPHIYSFFALAEIMATDAMHVPFLSWWSWPLIAKVLFLIAAFVLSPCILSLFLSWKIEGKPMPSVAESIAALAGWLALSMLIPFAFKLAVYYAEYTAHCAYTAGNHELYSVILYGVLAMLCLLVCGGACIVLRRTSNGDSTVRLRQTLVGQEADAELPQIPATSQAATELACAASLDARRPRKTWSRICDWACSSSRLPQWLRGASSRSNHMAAEWDSVRRRSFHTVLFLMTLNFWVLYGAVNALVFSTDEYWESQYDKMFGFIIQENQPYTAPVFVGEFGTGLDSDWFQKAVRYLGKRDLDWGYWPLNPVRPKSGIIDAGGNFVPYPDGDEIVNDTWSLLSSDWESVRSSWKLQRLKPIMKSPSGYTGTELPCSRSYSPDCGG
jgi:hypothetical protein